MNEFEVARGKFARSRPTYIASYYLRWNLHFSVLEANAVAVVEKISVLRNF